MAGVVQNSILDAFFHLAIDGDIKVMMASRVDYLLWACDPEYQHVVDKVLNAFEIKKLEESTFRHCGKEVVQCDRGGWGILI